LTRDPFDHDKTLLKKPLILFLKDFLVKTRLP